MGIFSFLKRSKKPAPESPPSKTPTQAPVAEAAPAPDPTVSANEPDANTGIAEPGVAEEKLDRRLEKSRKSFGSGILNFLRGGQAVDEELLEDLEAQLITSDIGITTTNKLMEQLRPQAQKKGVGAGDLRRTLHESLVNLLLPCEQPLEIPDDIQPFVILVVGVNGAGKTTTIGKIAQQLQHGGKSVMLAAGDTFRAAAVEQLQSWGERNQVPVISQGSGADSASVIFDALQSAKARGIDVLIADTAGRLHTQTGLMDELGKVARVMKKLDPNAPHEILLVLDGTTGQNSLQQGKLFRQAVGVTGLTITKLDGTAKGGVVFSMADELNIPIRFIGVGEGIYDLRVFQAQEFVDALLDNQAEISA